MTRALRPTPETGRVRLAMVWEAQDLAFFGYLAVVTVLLATLGPGREAIGHPWRLIGFHLLVGAAGSGAILLGAKWRTPLAQLVRWWYPAFLFTFCFEAVGWMIHLIHPHLIDASLVAADEVVFGRVLTPVFQSFARPWLTELMYLCYASYYFMVPGVGLALYMSTRNRETGDPGIPFRRFMLAVSLTFWVCYLHFLFTPAGGPVFWPDYPGPVLHLEGGPITALEQWIFRHGTIVGGAFPSSHVAVALVVAIFAVRYAIVPALLVPLATGLALSTIYAGYHYGVDVLYGMVVGTCCTFAAEKLFDWRERRSALRVDSSPSAREGLSTAPPTALSSIDT